MATDRDELMTASTAGALIGRSAASIRLYAIAGQLPHVRTPGGLRLYLRSEVLKFGASLPQAKRQRKSSSWTPNPGSVTRAAGAKGRLRRYGGRT
jgi:hypothetical protein